MAEKGKTAKQLREEAKILLKDAEALASKELAELKDDLTKKLKPHLDDFVKKVKELELSDNAQSAYDRFKDFIGGLTDEKQTKAKPVSNKAKPKKATRRVWTEEQKKKVLAYAEQHGVTKASKDKGVASSMIYSWRKKKT